MLQKVIIDFLKLRKHIRNDFPVSLGHLELENPSMVALVWLWTVVLQ